MFLYLPQKTKGAVYCRIIDAELGECILKMKKIRQEDNYDIYQITLDNHASFEPGLCQLYFMIINNSTVQTARVDNIYLKYDNFSAANKLFLMDSLSKEMKTICKQVEELTKLNIQLYQDIKEVSSK